MSGDPGTRLELVTGTPREGADAPAAFTYRVEADPRRTVAFVSRQVEELTGHRPDVFLSRRLGLIDLVHPKDRHGLRLAASRVTEGRPMSAEYRIVGADGAARRVLDVAAASEHGGHRWLDGRVSLLGPEVLDPHGAVAAVRDALTGLPTRRAVEDRIALELSRGTGATSLAILDVDHLRDCNAVNGHDACDRVLEAAGRRIRGCIRGVDVVGHAGAGRFWLVLYSTPLATAVPVAQRACDSVGRPGSDDLPGVVASAGVVQAAPGVDPAALVAAAEAALEAAKRAGGGRAVGGAPLAPPPDRPAA